MIGIIGGIIGHAEAATENALSLIRRGLPAVHGLRDGSCSCRSALALGIWSDKALIPAEAREKLAPLVGKYLAR